MDGLTPIVELRVGSPVVTGEVLVVDWNIVGDERDADMALLERVDAANIAEADRTRISSIIREVWFDSTS